MGLSKKQYLLIELLVAFLVICLLVALSIPRFLNAQVRMKISKVHRDFEILGKAFETYKTDHEIYPAGNAPFPKAWIGDYEALIWQRQLTTPFVYASFEDMIQTDFYPEKLVSGMNGGWYTKRMHLYKPPITYGAGTPTRFFPGSDRFHKGKEAYWMLFSCGPDRIDSKISNGWIGMGRFIYDSSNGLFSFGDIVKGGGMTHDTRYGVLWLPGIPEAERRPGRTPWTP